MAEQDNIFKTSTPYINTIPADAEPPYPGDSELEWRIRSTVRWNAMAMVVRANRMSHGIGGHISTYASAATLYEVAFNHFFRGHEKKFDRDFVYFQGHAAPGIYARAFLEGRLGKKDLENFRRELGPGGGLSSYPHPWLMPNFWEFPTVSMGLASLMSIYQARFMRYLQDRGFVPENTAKVWTFLGDGECDEPEALGAIQTASREKLDNLIFVINCNLQRLDGPVRGNGKIIQELESIFRGAGWNVIKVIWSSDWDDWLKKDESGLLVRRMGEALDGDYQKYSVEHGSYTREHFFGKYPELKNLVAGLSDEQIRRLRRGGHDPQKIYAAYKAAFDHRGGPTVVLAKTIKGYGLGEAGEGRNISHQQKKLNEDELRQFRMRFGIPIRDEDVARAPFYRQGETSEVLQYLRAQRKKLGGFVPERKVQFSVPTLPQGSFYKEFLEGTKTREVSTTMAFVSLLSKLLKDRNLGPSLVPIVADEARTFGMESLFRQCGIYSHVGQLYDPVDRQSLLYYREAKDGQILEEGITEAGAMASFIAAGTAYANYGLPMLPFFMFYSMFGLQRVGDLIWAAADSRTKGFLIGGTSGRTTLAGEGLQHQDGQSHLSALAVPNLLSYDVAFAFEMAVIVEDGLRRMLQKKEDIFYYLTLGNENYAMPSMPSGVRDGILKGLYLFKKSTLKNLRAKARLVCSGALVPIGLLARKILENDYKIAVELWSAPGIKQLYTEASEVERWNLLNPASRLRVSHVQKCLDKNADIVVIVSDYVKALGHTITKWIQSPSVVLGTDGFGRSDSRDELRKFFEVDQGMMVLSVLSSLARQGKLPLKTVKSAMKKFNMDGKKEIPYVS